jgi:uncharacterized protein (DUF427 family)
VFDAGADAMTTPNPDQDGWLAQARQAWTNTGARRPAHAVEPGPGQESVWDYPRPPVIVADRRLVVVDDPHDPIARTTNARRVLETASPPTFYVPSADIQMDRLVPVAGRSMCEWKGEARYWALATQPGTAVAWEYPNPFTAFAELAEALSFYPGRIRCTVDGETVRPQAGGFYGGWITDEIVGPFKGDPGTIGW